MSAPANKGYKRSWKNLLLNKRYQLRFTLFMVGLSALLMALLGWWVMTVAQRATTVAENNVLGSDLCHDPSGAAADVGGLGSLDQPAPAAPSASQPAAPAADDSKAKPVVTIDDSEMQMVGPDGKPVGPEAGGTGAAATAPAPATAAPSKADRAKATAQFEKCRDKQAAKIRDIENGKRIILWVLIGTGLLLVFGLLIYGIKMTHKTAGPLYKVSLYMAKLKDGRYDQVYNLRKGDHLVDFYEHFKKAHAGVTALQQEDVARLKALLAAADQAQLAGRSPELAEALGDLRTMLERKEKSLG